MSGLVDTELLSPCALSTCPGFAPFLEPVNASTSPGCSASVLSPAVSSSVFSELSTPNCSVALSKVF